jgi:hypothetical protein
MARKSANCGSSLVRAAWSTTKHWLSTPKRYEKKEKRLGYAELSVLLPSWKREHPFLSDAPAQALQQSSMHAVVVNVGTNQSIENRQDVPAVFHHSRENIA